MKTFLHECTIEESQCMDSRIFGLLRRRRRKCKLCKKLFSTIELIVESTTDDPQHLKKATIALIAHEHQLHNDQAEKIHSHIESLINTFLVDSVGKK